MVKRKGNSVQNADLAAFTEFSVHFFFADLCMLSSPVRQDGFFRPDGEQEGMAKPARRNCSAL